MKNKLKPGKTITDIKKLIEYLEGSRWVYFREKPEHPNFIRQLPFIFILDGLKRGAFKEADKTGEVK